MTAEKQIEALIKIAGWGGSARQLPDNFLDSWDEFMFFRDQCLNQGTGKGSIDRYLDELDQKRIASGLWDPKLVAMLRIEHCVEAFLRAHEVWEEETNNLKE